MRLRSYIGRVTIHARVRLTDGAAGGNLTQNLREAILTFRRYLVAAKDEVKKAEAYRRGLEYLERYYVLISYAVYLSETDIAAAEYVGPTQAVCD
jgi:hypothetical protein